MISLPSATTISFQQLTCLAIECTAKAVTHRIGKLKEIAQIPPVATPSKPKTPAKRARKGKSETNGAGDGDDNDSSESPTKKTKATPKKKAASSVSTPTPIKGEPVEMNRVKSEEGVSGEKEEELS